jgi:hypothetical protein
MGIGILLPLIGSPATFSDTTAEKATRASKALSVHGHRG